jgi:hypothetical protein
MNKIRTSLCPLEPRAQFLQVVQPRPGDPVDQRTAELRALVQQPVDRLGDKPSGDRVTGAEHVQPIPDLRCHHEPVRHENPRHDQDTTVLLS